MRAVDCASSVQMLNQSLKCVFRELCSLRYPRKLFRQVLHDLSRRYVVLSDATRLSSTWEIEIGSEDWHLFQCTIVRNLSHCWKWCFTRLYSGDINTLSLPGKYLNSDSDFLGFPRSSMFSAVISASFMVYLKWLRVTNNKMERTHVSSVLSQFEGNRICHGLITGDMSKLSQPRKGGGNKPSHQLSSSAYFDHLFPNPERWSKKAELVELAQIQPAGRIGNNSASR